MTVARGSWLEGAAGPVTDDAKQAEATFAAAAQRLRAMGYAVTQGG